jgi:hypothetical protein
MAEAVSHKCDQHADEFDCPDNLIHYSATRGYGIIIHDGGTAICGIRFCPWCGERLPESVLPNS